MMADTTVIELLQALRTDVEAMREDLGSRMGAVEERMGGLENRMEAVEERIEGLENRMGAIEERIGGLENRMGAVEERIGGLENRMGGLENRMGAVETSISRTAKMQYNSGVGRHEALQKVPNGEGEVPGNDIFPSTLNHLLVAGNERLPGTGDLNTWTKMKSRRLLHFYGAEEGYDTESENEYTPTARSMRNRVARELGVSQTQINLAVLAL